MSEIFLTEIPLEDIIPDPDQPRNLPSLETLRRQVEQDDPRAKDIWKTLLELAGSILDVGLEQPISVYPAEEDGKYILYDGHRRWLAVNILHNRGEYSDKILCQVRPSPQTQDTLLGQLSVNLQREDLNIFELARSLQQIYSELKLNGGEVKRVREDGSVEIIRLESAETDDKIWQLIEEKMGIVRSRRYQIQAVLKLPQKIQKMAEESGISESKLRYIIPISDTGEEILESLLREIIDQKMSIPQVRKRIAEIQGRAKSKFPTPVQIRSVLRSVNRLAGQVSAVEKEKVAGVIAGRDGRTVDGYIELLPDLEDSIEMLSEIHQMLQFLQKG